MKKLLLPMLVFLLLPTLVFADFDVHVSPTKVELFQNETKEVEVTIVNFGDSLETIDVAVTPEENWISVDDQVKVAADSSKDLIITIEPTAGVRGRYLKTLTFSSSKSGTKTESLEISVKESSIEITDLLPEDVFRPADEITLKATLVNRGELVDDAQFTFEIFDPEGDSYFKHEQEISLGATKTMEKAFQLKPNSATGKYKLIAKLSKEMILAKAETSFYIEAAPVVVVENSSSLGIFSIIHRRTITNLGNDVLVYQYNESIPSLGAMFFSSDEYEKEGESYSWSVELQPLEVRVITYELSYVPIAFFLLAVLSVYTYIRFFYSRVTLKKDFMKTGVAGLGGEIKIMLTIKNKSGGHLSTVIVRDVVPAMFRVTRQFGILRPVMRKSETAMNLVWHLRDLGPGEERVFTYAVSPVFGLTENFSLPRAIAIFEQPGGKKRIYSNAPKLGVSAEEEIG